MIDRIPPSESSSLILVVDDEPKNIQVVGSLLLKHGHEIIAATSGKDALAKLEVVRPDLILLDVMMPEMTGFELCQILQKDAQLRQTPIIFLSAAADHSFVVEALRFGGVDYVTKPFNSSELLSRVDLHSNLQKTRQRLDAIIREKTRLLEIVAHDLKNPLNGIQFAAMMLAEKSTGDPQQDLLVESIRDSAGRAFEIVSQLLATPRLDDMKTRIKPAPVCLKESAVRALKSFEQHVRNKEIRLDLRTPDDSVVVLGEHSPLLCCLENLISNAIKFSPKGASVLVQVLPGERDGEFRIEDGGPGIRDDERHAMFQKFTRLSARPTGGEASTGLGLHIVHELVHAMQGSVAYEKSSLGGACFVIRLPLAPRN